MTTPAKRIAAITKRQRVRKLKKQGSDEPVLYLDGPPEERPACMIATLELNTPREHWPYILHAISMIKGVENVDIKT